MKLLSSLTLILFLFGCSEPQTPATPPPPSVEVVTIGSALATTGNEYTASLQGKTDVEIRPQVDGFLETVLVDEGAFVHAGQVLFRINSQPFQEQLNSAAASLQAAEAATTNAQLEIDKLTPLVENKVVADYQLKAAKAAYKIAVANASQAKANLSAARIRLGYTLVKAPVSGYIGRLPKKRGSLVAPTDPEPLTQISDVHQVYAYFSLSETDFIHFKSQYPGSTLNDKLQQLPPVSLVLADNTVYPQTGKIDMVDGQFDKNTGAITLRAIFPNAQGLLRSGNTGKVRLQQQHTDAILVPQTATIDVQDKIFVYTVVDSNKVAKQPVQVIGKSGSNYIVKDGVKPGDRIVFSGLDRLIEGTVIKPEPIKANAQLSLATAPTQ
ncbi:membrane fusion protein, multidrug efflux system [Cnuella takakiae]|uniref:Membrane fusion protein, multidrug efflux system n=1 Tax=Cnuella takakiae TaxID=1302690 RepID=A0A1M4SWI7_9BACT|nr:efflux RND transporter periplasmic adaptor subunit [Cnuella takakiae]OLY90617.1 efflux transporter periplasmic adaptor subunit [Cnuella takakiae]SHE36565.1 membrane fusion protein, multidrug efflux system [Cnuella takakiae]